MRRVLILVLSLVFSTSIIGCAAKQSIPIGQVPVAEAPSVQKVKETSHAIASNFRKDGVGLRQSGPDYERVQKILLRLETAAGVKGFNFPLYLADSADDVNAMAVNGNTIVVYSELANRVKSDAELATVMSHEVGHILAKHHEDDSSEERASIVSIGSTILGTAAAIGAAYAGLGSAGVDLAGDTAAMATQVVGVGAFVRSYDRDLEREADHVGLMLMAKAGYDPNAAVRFWSKSEQIFGEKSGFSFLSTHPSSGDRQDRLLEAMPIAMKYYEAQKAAPLKANQLHQKPGLRNGIRLVSAGGQTNSRGLSAHSGSHSEEQLYLKIERAYLRRGYEPGIAKSVIQNLRSSMVKVPRAHRKASLEQILQSVESK